MKYEYELISHNYIRGFHLFLVRILYRTPHLHREFEVNLILDGSVEILSQGRGYHAETGDFFVFDPYQPHELRAREGTVLILSIQISPTFFSNYFPVVTFFYISLCKNRHTDLSIRFSLQLRESRKIP